jgi:peptide/nickel transport system substrate-binding protein
MDDRGACSRDRGSGRDVVGARFGAVAALGAWALLAAALSGCGAGNGSAEGPPPSPSSSVGQVLFDTGSTAVVRPSSARGGTLKVLNTDDWDSPDPGNTYYAYSWDFARLYGRTLTTYADEPGRDGLLVVPDLATDLGKVSPDGRTVTYTLKPGIKYDDGSVVRSADVKYAIERSNFAPEVLSNGPTYFHDLLGTDYRGPYQDPSGDLNAIETPDDNTIVFHLTKPFPEFDYLATLPQTTPVPRARDDGAKYAGHVAATGPYRIDSYEPGKTLALSRNPNWDAPTDPSRRQLVDRIEVTLKVNPADLDQRLLAGDADYDVTGVGVGLAAQAAVLRPGADAGANVDNPLTGFIRYVAIDTKVAPFDNIHCRKAVILAADHESLQTAYGGPHSGDIASTMMPPTLDGYAPADSYGFAAHPNGDLAAAKDELVQCGKPDGFTTTISARGDRPKEVAGALSLQQALKKINVNVSIEKYPSGQYLSNYAGSTNFAHTHRLGLMFTGWAADWPSGYGFLQQIVDGGAIKASGNSNLSELNDPTINDLFVASLQEPELAKRTALWSRIDAAVMADAAIIPIVYEKVLLYRSPRLTNAYVDRAFGMYNYSVLGLQP